MPYSVVFLASLECAEVAKILLNRGSPAARQAAGGRPDGGHRRSDEPALMSRAVLL
ncbi:MAG: hypothetical protein MZV70_67270 [Desulfobacterales bacterium]|nr:hypothetical protein [Desulfobacterales bacterium]